MRLSLCMIVRDNEDTIGPCLESIQPWVDETIVVDTGSTDRTPEIVKSFGAKLSFFEWCDDFSSARNKSIEAASGDWIFWMDSDDTIPHDCGERLRALADSKHADTILGYVMQVRCPANSSRRRQEFTVVDHVKMFRNRPEIRFEGRIHEQVLMPIRRLGGEVGWTDIYVEHSGADDSVESQRRKIERDLRILRKDLADRPNHPFVLFNFAMTYAESRNYRKALLWTKRCLRLSNPGESHVRKAFAYLASCQMELGNFDGAIQAAEAGRQLFPDDPELLFREAMVLNAQGRNVEAINSYEQLLRLDPTEAFQSTDPSITGYKCRFNLGVVLQETGEDLQAENQFRQALADAPWFYPAQRALLNLLLERGRVTAAEVELERFQSELKECDQLIYSARISEKRGAELQAGQLIDKSLDKFPTNELALEEGARFHFVHANWGRAESILNRLVENNPMNGAALHNLAAICLQRNDRSRAVELLKRSLEVRPDSESTRQLLLQAMA